MEIVPSDIRADGLKIYADIGGLSMHLSDDMVKKYCGHLPKTEIRAKIMARKLKGRRLEFSNNISFGQQRRKIKTLTGNRDNPEYRRERIERKRRRERNVMKVNIGVKLDSDVKKHELFARLIEIDGVKRVKKVTDSSIELETDKNMENKLLGQKEINEKIVKLLEEDYDGIKEITSIDYQD